MLKKRRGPVSYASAVYSTPRDGEMCASVCACDRTPLLKKTV